MGGQRDGGTPLLIPHTSIPPPKHMLQEILEPILGRVGFPVVADVPGVGEHLGNDGVVMVTLNRSAAAAVNPVRDDLYAGGAFTPYPNPAANPDDPFQASG